MRRLVLGALVVFGCGKSLAPTDVELTINTRATAVNGGATINDADVASVSALELTLSGSETDHTRYDLSRPLLRTEKLVIHLKRATGTLTIGVLARDAQGLVVGIGNMTATLHDGNPQIFGVDLQPPPDGTHAVSAVSLTPLSAQLFTGQTVALTSASVVTWSIAAGGAGGTIDDKGRYTAPTIAGSDTIEADSTIYFGEHRTAQIDVLKTGVLRYAGLPAGAGTVDGTGSDARVSSPRGMAFDGAGHVLFSDASNVVRRLDIASGAVTTIAGTLENSAYIDAAGTAASFANPWNVAWDAQRGALYVADNNTVRKLVVATGAVTTLAGMGNMWGSMDGTGSAARFEGVQGFAFDGDKTLYASDVNAATVRAIDVTTGAVTTVAGIADSAGYVDGPAGSAKFDWPASLALDGQGGLFVGDSHNQLIRKIDLGAKMVSTVTGKPGIASSVDGPFGTATVSYPEQMVYDGMGALYIGGRKIDVATGAVTTIVKGDWSPIDALAFAPDGRLWAATNSALETVDLAGFQLTPVAGVHQTNADHNHVDGTRWVARFNSLAGIAAAADGTLIVRDGNSIRRVDPAADTVTELYVYSQWWGNTNNLTVAADGTIYIAAANSIYTLSPSEGYATLHTLTGSTFDYADGALAQAKFACPMDVAVSGKVLYVADSCNNVIRAVDLAAGMVSTLAGTAKMGGLVDMPGSAARFNFPQGLAADDNGNLYVASNNAVRKIVIATADVSTLAGGDAPGFADGSGTAAKFSVPAHLVLDRAKQRLYVSDVRNTAIRKVTLAGDVTTVAGGPGKVVVTPGALPGAINEPNALAMTPSGDLFVTVPHEESLLQIRLP